MKTQSQALQSAALQRLKAAGAPGGLGDPLTRHALRDPLRGAPVQRQIDAPNLAGLIHDQYLLQQDVKANPNDYAERYTTVGFEHEFAQMEDGPLRGRSHVEVAKSEQTMPYTGLPFFLETDAANALELVSAPLLIETIPHKPIPLPDDVEAVDALFQQALTDKTDGNPTFNELVQSFAQEEGLRFTLNDVTLGWENLSPNMPEPLSADNATVDAETLAAIRLKTSEKNGGVHAQANFATDAETYIAIERQHRRQRSAAPNTNTAALANFEATIRGELQGAVDTVRGTLTVSPKLNGFLEVMARNLAGQISIPAISELAKVNKRAFQTGTIPEKNEDIRSATNPNGDAAPRRGAPQLHPDVLSLSSNVKDTGSTWIKDNLINIGLGMLTPDDWRVVKRLCKHGPLLTALTEERALPSAFTGNGANLDAKHRWAKLISKAMSQIRSHVKKLRLERATTNTDRLFVGPDERVHFLGHDPKWIAPRQDTFIDGEKVQMPGVWDNKRLHVVETRRNLKGSMDLLRGLYGDQIPEKGAPPPEVDAWDFSTDPPPSSNADHDLQAPPSNQDAPQQPSSAPQQAAPVLGPVELDMETLQGRHSVGEVVRFVYMRGFVVEGRVTGYTTASAWVHMDDRQTQTVPHLQVTADRILDEQTREPAAPDAFAQKVVGDTFPILERSLLP